MTKTVCHAELVYATRAFALRKLFNAALACLGHQHPFNLKKICEKTEELDRCKKHSIVDILMIVFFGMLCDKHEGCLEKVIRNV